MDEHDNPPPPENNAPPSAPPPNSAPRAAVVDEAAGISEAPPGGALGDQVHPATQTREDDGHRTLALPVTDPGPYIPEGGVDVKHPDRNKGEHRYSDANESIGIVQRTSTGHDAGYGRPGGPQVTDTEMAPDVAVNGAASDVYNKEQGEGLTDMAVKKANEPRVAAPVHE